MLQPDFYVSTLQTHFARRCSVSSYHWAELMAAPFLPIGNRDLVLFEPEWIRPYQSENNRERPKQAKINQKPKPRYKILHFNSSILMSKVL